MDAIRLQFHFVRGGRINDCEKNVCYLIILKSTAGKKNLKKETFS
jgi:hypothetical protein